MSPRRPHHLGSRRFSKVRNRSFARKPAFVALAAAALALALAAPAPALANGDAVAHLRDSLYVPEGMELNSLNPAGTHGGLGGNYTAAPGGVDTYANSQLPSAFDLRDMGGTSYVTPVKNQNPWGTCWAFSAVSALESSLLMQGAGSADPQAQDYVDLSELFVSGFSRMEVPAETLARIGASSQAGEGITPMPGVDYLNTGGNPSAAAAWIMAMGGVPTEAAAPYESDDEEIWSWQDTFGLVTCFSPEGGWTLAEALRADLTNRVATVDSVTTLPGPYNSYYDANGELVLGEYDPAATEAIKRTIMESGAVSMNYYSDFATAGDEMGSTPSFSMENWCQYAYEPQGINHCVTVVGWDDDYPRENFPTEPAGDGAWIVKNSWGGKDAEWGIYSEWGFEQSGYFYLSYYDKTIFSVESIEGEANIDSDRIIQQYDLLGVTDLISNSLLSREETSAANVFTAEEDMLIEGVTAYAGAAGMDTEVAVYLLDEGSVEPDSGALVATQSSYLPHVGFYTVEFDDSVPVQKGQRYAVVQTTSGAMSDGEGGTVDVWGVPVESAVSHEILEQMGYMAYYDVVSNEGESYLKNGGLWLDATELNDDPVLTSNGVVTYGNACIKVYGTPADLPDSGEFTVLHTNDIHGRYSVKGTDASAVNAFAAVAALAEDTGADLILDAGDTFHGTTFSTASKGDAIAQLMDAAGYDATTPGNHDWSYGSARLAEIDADAEFSVLAANVTDAESDAATFEDPYLLREVALADSEGNLTGRSVTVGVLGVIDEDLHGSTAPSNVAGVEFGDSVKAANETAAQLRAAGADVVVALTHNEDPQAFAAATEGIDAVVAGHEHIAIDETVKSADGRSVAVVEVASSPSAEYFGSIGVLDIELEASADESSDAEFTLVGHLSEPVSTASVARPNEKIDALTAALVAQSEETLAQIIGRSSRAYEYAPSTADAPGGWELVRTEDTPIGHVVTGAYLAQTGADLAFENAGGIRGGIPTGDVTAADIANVSPYGNTLATYKLTGAQVLDAIERSLSISAECRDVLAKQEAAAKAGEDPMQYEWPRKSGSVLAVGGAVMTVDWSKPDGQRVTKIEVGGSPLDPSRVYTVALNSYLPGATETYPSFAQAQLVHEYGTCEEALRALISQDGWEQLMTRISGSVTYVPADGGSDEGAGSTPPSGDLSATGGTPSASLPTTESDQPGAIPATGDSSTAYVLLASTSALLMAGLWYAMYRARKNVSRPQK